MRIKTFMETYGKLGNYTQSWIRKYTLDNESETKQNEKMQLKTNSKSKNISVPIPSLQYSLYDILSLPYNLYDINVTGVRVKLKETNKRETTKRDRDRE